MHPQTATTSISRIAVHSAPITDNHSRCDCLQLLCSIGDQSLNNRPQNATSSRAAYIPFHVEPLSSRTTKKSQLLFAKQLDTNQVGHSCSAPRRTHRNTLLVPEGRETPAPVNNQQTESVCPDVWPTDASSPSRHTIIHNTLNPMCCNMW